MRGTDASTVAPWFVDEERNRQRRTCRTEIGEPDADISYVGMDEDEEHAMTQLRFTIQVKDRVHLAHLIRDLRGVAGVTRVERERA